MMKSRLRSFSESARAARAEQLLAEAGFSGDFESGLGSRYVASTDNSIYQLLPAAIAYPRAETDLSLLARVGLREQLSLTARGGNTGTNGQSLNRGLIVDFSRYMCKIRHFDADSGNVTVEPGVVLDQLNAFLAPYGRFFPPMVSTASRATIGGMVATDASGKGSRRYGRTSDYISSIDLTLADGTEWRAQPMSRAEAQAIASGTGLVADIHREALRIVTERPDEIEAVFPKMNRGLTGYNFSKLYQADKDQFFLGNVIAGSEGTLALIRSVTLRTEIKPKCAALAVLRYSSFDAALRDVPRLIRADPTAIEILDDQVLAAARSDILWSRVEKLLGHSDVQVAAINFAEFAELDNDRLEVGLARLSALAQTSAEALIDVQIARDPDLIGELWCLREKSVGLLGRIGGGRQGMPFVEDTAVPPESLADYALELRGLLEGYGLKFGMFGHADVGCLHVRPFLDLRDPDQANLVRPVSDAVAALAKSYGGLLWGEHGRGFRGEYAPLFFGPISAELNKLKLAFDPNNLFNPGKLAVPDQGGEVERIDEVPLRADSDRMIGTELLGEFERSIACNGNGACFSWDAVETMCPSYKVTRDRVQSPKGRASLLRTWAQLSSNAHRNEQESLDLAEVEQATMASLSTCLACRACTTGCPVKVDMPTMKSRFLHCFYKRRRRPVRHAVLAHLEAAIAFGGMMPRLTNALTQSLAGKWVAREMLGFVDLPGFSKRTKRRRLPIVTAAKLSALPAEQRDRAVVLVEDSFTSNFDVEVVEAASEVLLAYGYPAFRLPARQNGKVLHLLGLRKQFSRIAHRRMRECQRLAGLGARLVGVDAATALMFAQEYAEFTGSSLDVIGIEKLLLDDLSGGITLGERALTAQREHTIVAHCMEQALRPDAAKNWVELLALFGVQAVSKKTGCCGMAGLFGHESRNAEMSKKLFDLSWKNLLEDKSSTLLATGFSCRCQTKRFGRIRARHPIELLRTCLSPLQPV